MREITAEVQQAEASESELVERATNADGKAAWVVGECASLWTQRYAKGRTDQAFAEMCGMEPDRVQKRRHVFETFGGVSATYPKLSWSHFRAALTWDDWVECFEWATDNTASVREMVAWRRMQRGEDLTVETDESQGDPLPEPPKAAPHAGGTASAGSPAAPVLDTAASQTGSMPGGKAKASSQAVPPSPFNPLPVTPKKPAAAPSIESRQFTLADLRKWLQAAEDNAEDVRERRKLAAWHRKRADELDPQAKTKAKPASVDEVRVYIAEKELDVDAEVWWDFYESNGWKVGKNAMKSWHAAIGRAHREGWAKDGKARHDGEPWRHIEGSGARHVPDTIQVYDAASGGFVTRPAGSA